jgi:hypothetical protein
MVRGPGIPAAFPLLLFCRGPTLEGKNGTTEHKQAGKKGDREYAGDHIV